MKANCSLCEKMVQLSHETWERIAFARSRKGFKVYETTITQNLLFELKKFSERCGKNHIEMFEAINEKVNGNDIEVFLQIGSTYICLPMQAKIIYKNSKYPTLNHGNQIYDLITYSKKIEGFPLYLFYNHSDVHKHLSKFGCSLVSAHYLERNYIKHTKWTIPSFNDLHPLVALPWYVLGCCTLENIEGFPYFERLQIDSKELEGLKKYTYEELIEDENWKEISFERSIASTENCLDLVSD